MSTNLLPPSVTLTINAFRASENRELSERFLTGHQKILKDLGVNPSSGAKHAWMDDPSSILVVVQKDDKILGGARIQVNSGRQPLPIENALEDIEPEIKTIVQSYEPETLGEVCGLWNERSTTLLGVGAIYITEVCIAIAHNIGIKSMLAFCASYTVPTAHKVGYQTMTEIGNEGGYAYPKPDMMAYATLLSDVENLPFAKQTHKENIRRIRAQKNQTVPYITKRAHLNIKYDIEL